MNGHGAVFTCSDLVTFNQRVINGQRKIYYYIPGIVEALFQNKHGCTLFSLFVYFAAFF